MGTYKELLIETILENYTQTHIKKIYKTLLERNIISTEDDLITLAEQSVVVSGQNYKSDIIAALNGKENETIRVIEELEYSFGYKYSSIFTVQENFLEKVKKDFNSNVFNFRDESFISDNLTFNFMNPYNLKPTFYKIEEDIYAFKFSLNISGYQGRENPIKKSIKYPVIAYYFEKMNIIEVRLDSLKGFLKNGDELFYTRKIERIANWFTTHYSKTSPLNLSPIIEYISKSDNQEVNVAAQLMSHSSGSKTILDTGSDNISVLPILGDLKKIISDNLTLFNVCKTGNEIHKILQEFINEIEESSDLPWISLRWVSTNGKSNIARVKFSFDYKKTTLDLLQYYDSSNTEMEKMNYVTKHIVDHKIKYESEETLPEEAGQVI